MTKQNQLQTARTKPETNQYENRREAMRMVPYA